MTFYHHKDCGGSRRLKNPGVPKHFKMQLPALLLCLTMLSGVLPALTASAEENTGNDLFFSHIVEFQSITLHYAGADGQPEKEAIQDNTLIAKDRQLALRYTYEITEEQSKKIQANTEYYLKVSPHLVLPDLKSGSPLTIKIEDSTVEFGKIYADGSRAWVAFSPNNDNSGTIIEDCGGISNAFFYLNCDRAAAPPAGEPPLDGHSNLYAMKFENDEQLVLTFGYAENEPVSAAAQIAKNGSLKDKTITWNINYTPWQNPSAQDPVDLNTPFELRDTLDTALHDYVKGSAKIDGTSVPEYSSRDMIPADSEAYMIVESSENPRTTSLIFGGTRLNAGQATAGKPANMLTITYETSIADTLLLPGGSGGSKITNAAELFAGKNGAFNSLSIRSQAAVPVPRPTWLEKSGTTTRHTDGTGSTTDWTVTFYPNGFSFAASDKLTLHDQLPAGSTLVKNSVNVSGANTNVTVTEENGTNAFTVDPIAADPKDGQPIKITYQTKVSEDMYDSGTSLGNNTAWFTFRQNGTDYETPKITAPVGSGDGSGTPGTATLVKKNTGYDPATRSITWTVTINPHKAELRGGTFTDDLSAAGGVCRTGEHTGGLELKDGVNGIDIKINGLSPTDNERKLLTLKYDQQVLTIKAGEIGRKTITLQYTTKVCDPCIFANNTAKTSFKNTISTNNMRIGSSATERSASADSTADVSASVLTKKPPVYDYAAGIMHWIVEVDAAGLPMTEVVLTDTLPAGLTYKDNSLSTAPAITGAAADTEGQELTIDLGTVKEKTTVTFDTQVDPAVLGFGSDQPVIVENTIHMNGNADGVRFTEVSHRVQQNFSNHGLVKSSTVDNQQELIQYEVLINPYRLSLPENPALIDTLDPRLQLDTDTLRFCKATLSGTTAGNAQKPGYQKTGDAQPLKITDYDPQANCFTVRLPIPDGSRDAYVLTYTADIIDRQAGGYGNSVRFDGGSVLLGGSKDNSAAVGGGGGGGGGGVAARKAEIAVVKTDSENQKPLAGVVFTLYQWDSADDTRGLPFARGTTDAQGKLSFKVKPNAVYELVEEQSIPGYGSALGWEQLPPNVTATDQGLLITAGAARSKLELALTNEAHTADIVFRLLNHSGIPMAGTTVQLFTFDPAGMTDPVPAMEAAVAADGKLRFSGVRRGAFYYLRQPDGEILKVYIPAELSKEPTIEQPGGTKVTLTEDYQATGTAEPEQQWILTVTKVTGGDRTPLADADIGLYAEEACRTLLASGVSGPDGIVAFEGLMKGQTYWVKELKAPEGYRLDPQVFPAEETDPSLTISNVPEEPAVEPEEPEDPDVPATPEQPDDPRNPVKPADPDKPESPDSSGSSERPDVPEKPGSSERPKTPGKSSHTGSADALDHAEQNITKNVAGLLHVPPTGDDTPVFFFITLLSGTLLALFLFCLFTRSKKRLP